MNNKKQTPTQLNVDLSNSTGLVCSECGNPTFIQSFMIRKISAIYVGEEAILPVQVYECSECGCIADWSVPSDLKGGNKSQPEEEDEE